MRKFRVLPLPLRCANEDIGLGTGASGWWLDVILSCQSVAQHEPQPVGAGILRGDQKTIDMPVMKHVEV